MSLITKTLEFMEAAETAIQDKGDKEKMARFHKLSDELMDMGATKEDILEVGNALERLRYKILDTVFAS